MDIFPPAKQRPALLALRDALGCRDNALSDEERERLTPLGHRFEKRSDVGGGDQGEKPASDDLAGLMPADGGEGEI